MSTEKDTTYNGWTNYETWVVNLWLANEPGTSEELSTIAGATTEHASVRGDTLKSYVEEVCELPTTGLAGDLIGAAMSSVNWIEIIRNHEDDNEE